MMENFSKIILTLFPLLIILSSQLNYDKTDTKAAKDSGFLAHTVYFYLNDDVTAEEKEQFEAGLKTLLNIAEIQKAEMGIPAETKDREVTDNNFVYSIFLQFETMEDYEVYAEHPDHLKFIEAYKHLWADVKVYDSEITYER